MSIQTDVDVDTSTIEDLDFVPACDAEDCDQPAAWAFVVFCPAKRCTVNTWYACQPHAEHVREKFAKNLGRCVVCGCVTVFERAVTWHRIGGGG